LGYLITGLAFEPRYSGTRQLIFECGITVTRSGFDSSGRITGNDLESRGESLKAIGRAFGKPSSSIYFQVAPHGGIDFG
jgi:hypothetical protein